MKTYKVEIKKSALKDIKGLPKPYSNRVIRSIRDLANNPRPRGCKKLRGYINLWRIRIGEYRVIYSIKDEMLVVYILEAGNRKDVY